jgi:hypothetical protein
VLGVSALCLGIPASLSVFYNLRGLSQPLAGQLGRFAVALVLCVLVYRGYAPARFALAGLSLLLGAASAVGGSVLVLADRARLGLFAVAAAYLACSGVLLLSRSIREFQASR